MSRNLMFKLYKNNHILTKHHEEILAVINVFVQ